MDEEKGWSGGFRDILNDQYRVSRASSTASVWNERCDFLIEPAWKCTLACSFSLSFEQSAEIRIVFRFLPDFLLDKIRCIRSVVRDEGVLERRCFFKFRMRRGEHWLDVVNQEGISIPRMRHSGEVPNETSSLVQLV